MHDSSELNVELTSFRCLGKRTQPLELEGRYRRDSFTKLDDRKWL
jgi:hypothetical protein